MITVAGTRVSRTKHSPYYSVQETGEYQLQMEGTNHLVNQPQLEKRKVIQLNVAAKAIELASYQILAIATRLRACVLLAVEQPASNYRRVHT